MKDPVARAAEKFKTHPSVLIIKDKIFQGNKFSFTEVSQSEIGKEIKNLNYDGPEVSLSLQHFFYFSSEFFYFPSSFILLPFFKFPFRVSFLLPLTIYFISLQNFFLTIFTIFCTSLRHFFFTPLQSFFTSLQNF